MIIIRNSVDLATPRLGGKVLYSTDDFFAEASGLIDPKEPVFIEGKFTEHGKWMDGWESRRKRVPGHDHCILRICRGSISTINIDTSHFTGNFPESASVEACDSDGDPDDASTQWIELVPKTELVGDSHNLFEITSKRAWTHLRLHIYPDGGVARLRVYGEVYKNWNLVKSDEQIDLLAMENGGVAIACSDMHFGEAQNLTAPGRGINMGDGWETTRRRGPGHDWAILRLGKPGNIQKVQIDTLHFKGNYPARCAIKGVYTPNATVEELTSQGLDWKTIIPETPVGADQLHDYVSEVQTIGKISHVKLEMHPDGGVGRLRVFGTI